MKKLFAVLKLAYSVILRPLVVDKIKESPTQIDDVILKILDSLFEYDEPGS